MDKPDNTDASFVSLTWMNDPFLWHVQNIWEKDSKNELVRLSYPVEGHMNTCTKLNTFISPPLPSPLNTADTEPDAVLQFHVSFQTTWKE